MDIARWALGKNELPSGVVSVGGRFGYIDDGQTAEHADLRLRLRRRRADLRGARPQDRPAQGPSRSATSSTARKATSSSTSYSNATAFTNGGEMIKKFNGGDDPLRQLRRRRPQRQAGGLSTPTSRRATCPAPCATSATSATASARNRRSKRSRTPWPTRRRQETFERMEKHLKRQSGVAGRDQVPRRPPAEVRPQDRDVHRRQGRRRAADARVPQGLRGAGQGVTKRRAARRQPRREGRAAGEALLAFTSGLTPAASPMQDDT